MVRTVSVATSIENNVCRPFSDVAVLTKGLPADDDAIVDRLAERLERTLRVPRVDVVALSRAALPLRYRIIRDGTLIVSRDAARLERFIVESTLHYLDFAPLREQAFRIQQARFLRMVADPEIIHDRESRIREYTSDLRSFAQISEADFLANRSGNTQCCMRCSWR